MDFLEAARRALFEQMYGTDRADAEAKAGFLRRIGVPEEQIAGFCRPGLHAGMALGGAHVIDVSRYERGAVVPSFDVACKIADALDVSVADLRDADG